MAVNIFLIQENIRGLVEGPGAGSVESTIINLVQMREEHGTAEPKATG